MGILVATNGSVPNGIDSNAAPHLSDPSKVPAQLLEEVQKKYAEERDKRVRSDGLGQYVNQTFAKEFQHLWEDPWVALEPKRNSVELQEGSKVKFLIQGAGFGGLLYAVRLVQAGFKPEDICFVDYAGGFGGTWYWNRYPGLMCDVESYIYLPLLEETGYVPKHRYSYGPEIREHANRIAEQWKLEERGFFSTEIKSATWNEDQKEWVIRLARKGSEFNVRTQFFISAAGVLNFAQVPDLPGIHDFQGSTFHTSRWDYTCTGGSPDDWTMENLKGKRVGILGTGATAVQAVPELARWADELHVFQRTPSAIDIRGQRQTDPVVWKSTIASKQGWQRERQTNFCHFVSNIQPPLPNNMVDDGWTYLEAYHGLVGSPNVPRDPAKIPEFLNRLHSLDVVRQERIRARVNAIVKDKDTAEKLKAWYPSWCKRPAFHDEYLPTFNLPHVHLVDTDGKGVDRLTKSGVVVQGKEYPLDILIFSTGFLSPGVGTLATRGNVTITGRGGLLLRDKFANGVRTLHGVVSRDFPNLFYAGPGQTGATANQAYVLDQLSIHVAHIVAEAHKGQDAEATERVTIEPTAQAEEDWASQILIRACGMAAVLGCTPGYINLEGAVDKETNMEEKIEGAKGATWGEGIISYLDVIQQWRTKGGLEGLEVRS